MSHLLLNRENYSIFAPKWQWTVYEKSIFVESISPISDFKSNSGIIFREYVLY